MLRSLVKKMHTINVNACTEDDSIDHPPMNVGCLVSERNATRSPVQPVCNQNTCKEPSSEFGSTINKDSNDDLSTLNIIKETLSDELDISVDGDFLNETSLDQLTPDSPKNVEKEPTSVGIDSTDKEKISEDVDSTMKQMATKKQTLDIKRMFICYAFVDSKCNEANRTSHRKYKYVCIACSRVVYSVNAMYRHRKRHLKIKELQCNICNHQFANTYDLKLHQKHVQSGNWALKNSKRLLDYKGMFIRTAFVEPECNRVCTLKRYEKVPYLVKCPYCPKSFNDTKLLQPHIRNHKKYKYVCTVCPKVLYSANGMYKHRKMHLQIKELQCDICNHQFAYNYDLKLHKEQVHSGDQTSNYSKFVAGDDVSKETRCFEDKEDKAFDDQPVGGLIITNKPLLGFGNSATQEKSKVASAGEPVFQQPKQSSGLKSWNELPVGLGIEIVEKEKSDDNYTIFSESSLDDSIITNELQYETRFPCAVPQCEEIFLYRQELIDHYISQHNMASVPFTCSVCDNFVENNIQVLKHINSHVKKSFVEEQISLEATYLTEKLDEIPENVNNEQVQPVCDENTCEEPSSEFGSTINKDSNDDLSTLNIIKETLSDELDISVDSDFLNETPLDQPTPDSPKNVEKEPTTVEIDSTDEEKISDDNDARMKLMAAHKQTLDIKKMFIRSAFIDSKSNEANSTSQSKYKYVCIVCSKVLYSCNGMYRHRKRHRQIKELQCDICSHQFACNYDLNLHKKNVHSGIQTSNNSTKISDDNNSSEPLNGDKVSSDYKEPYTRYKCSVPQCEENFTHHRDAMNHYINQHDMGKIPYMCPVCGKIDSKNVYKHVKSHVQATVEYKCPECPAVYRYSKILKTHMQLHTGKWLYKCPQCSKEFRWQLSLKRHIETHSRAHKCNICSKEFSTKNNLRSHLKSHL